jgi:hypothetical protein
MIRTVLPVQPADPIGLPVATAIRPRTHHVVRLSLELFTCILGPDWNWVPEDDEERNTLCIEKEI